MCPAALLPGEPRDYPQNTDVISSAGSQPAAFLPGFVAAHTRGSVRGSVGVSGPHGWVPLPPASCACMSAPFDTAELRDAGAGAEDASAGPRPPREAGGPVGLQRRSTEPCLGARGACVGNVLRAADTRALKRARGGLL